MTAPTSTWWFHLSCWVQRICSWLWNSVLLQLLAESLWDIAMESVFCVRMMPLSIQVIASELLGASSGLGEAQSLTTGTGGDSSSESTHDTQPRSSSAPTPAGDMGYLWVHNSQLASPEALRLRRQLHVQIGSWLSLTCSTVMPNGNPPRWPTKGSGGSTKGNRDHANNDAGGLRGGGGGGGTELLRSLRLPQNDRSAPMAECLSVPTLMRSGGGHPSIPPPVPSGSRLRHKVLVLDLDETLMFASTSTANKAIPPSFSEAIPTVAGAELLHVWQRPHLQLFLNAVSSIYNVVVFTAAAPSYADPILNRVDGTQRRIKKRFYREQCTPMKLPKCPVTPLETHTPESDTEIRLVKNLAVLGVPLSHVVFVDNSSHCCILNPDNSIIVPSYHPPLSTVVSSQSQGAGDGSNNRCGELFVDRDDDVLLGLIPILEALSFVSDVRDILRASNQTWMRRNTNPTTQEGASLPHADAA